MRWLKSWRADPAVLPLADRHYNRQKPGSKQFVPPGRCLVLKTEEPVTAFWVTSYPFAQHVKHRWAGAWVCSAFRNEWSMRHLSSELIREAVAATRWYYGAPPKIGEKQVAMISFVDPRFVRHKRDPGRCFIRAGFELDGFTVNEGLLAFVLRASDVPEPVAPLGCEARHKDFALEASL